MKLNVDGRCRGNPGKFHVAFSRLFGDGTNNEAKQRALKEGVELYNKLDFLQIIIECDSC